MNNALQVSSTSTGSSWGIEKMRRMLEKNDYPTHRIEKSKKRATERNRTQQPQKKKTCGDGILRLPSQRRSHVRSERLSGNQDWTSALHRAAPHSPIYPDMHSSGTSTVPQRRLMPMHSLPSWSGRQMHNQKCHLQARLCHLLRELHRETKRPVREAPGTSDGSLEQEWTKPMGSTLWNSTQGFTSTHYPLHSQNHLKSPRSCGLEAWRSYWNSWGHTTTEHRQQMATPPTIRNRSLSA